jgi:hypothetical protein
MLRGERLAIGWEAGRGEFNTDRNLSNEEIEVSVDESKQI